MTKGVTTFFAVAFALILALGAMAWFWRGEAPGPTIPVRETAERKVTNAKHGRSDAQTYRQTAAVQSGLPDSFQSALDLYAFSVAALKSNDPGVIYEGYRALRECEGLSWMANDLRIAADGGKLPQTMSGEFTEERRLAILDVLRRCEGFSKIDYRDREKLGQEFLIRGRDLNSVEFVLGLRERTPTAEEFAQLLSSSSPNAVRSALLSLPQSIEDQKGMKPEKVKRREVILGLGALLASCDLGLDCSASAFPQQYLCVVVGECGKTQFENWESEFTKAEVEAVDAQRQRIVQAVKTGDYSKLGIQ